MEDTIYYISEASKKVQVEPHVLRYWEEELQLAINRNEMGHRCYTQKDIETFSRIRLLKEQGLQLKAIRLVLRGDEDFLPREEPQPESSVQADADALAEMNVRGEANKQGETHAQAGTNAQLEADVQNGLTKTNVQTDGNVQAETKGQADRNIRPERDMLEEKVEDMVMKKAKKYMVTMSKGKETVVEMPREEELQEYEEPVDEKTKKAARLQYLLQHMVTEAVKSANQEMCTEIKESILKELDYQFRQQEERDEAHWKQEEEHYRKIDEMIRQRRLTKGKFSREKK